MTTWDDAADPAPDVNMTPLIDVTFLLLVFFTMISVLNDMEREADVQLPEAWATIVDRSPADRLIVNVEKDGAIVLFGRPATIEQLRRTLRERRDMLRRYEQATGQPPIVVRGHRACPYEHVEAVLDAIRAERLNKILFAAYEIREKDR
jgi:biopolymer transport protein ExbD